MLRCNATFSYGAIFICEILDTFLTRACHTTLIHYFCIIDKFMQYNNRQNGKIKTPPATCIALLNIYHRAAATYKMHGIPKQLGLT